MIFLGEDEEDFVFVVEFVGFLEADGQVHVFDFFGDHWFHG